MKFLQTKFEDYIIAYKKKKFEYIIDPLYINEEQFDDMWKSENNNIITSKILK